VGNLFEDIHTEPLAEFHHALLVAGRAEMAALAGERQKIFVVRPVQPHDDAVQQAPPVRGHIERGKGGVRNGFRYLPGLKYS